MTKQEEKEQEMLALVKEFPGLSTRQYWLRLHLSEALQPAVRARLLHLALTGKVRYEETMRGGQVYARRWFPIDAVKEKKK